MAIPHSFSRHAARLAAVLLCAAPAWSQHTWDGSCGNTLWHTTCPGQTNWLPETLPGLTDAVIIPRTAPTVLNFGGVAEALTISCQSGLLMTNGGQLRLAGAGGKVANFTIENGGINLITPGTVLEMTGNGMLTGASLFGSGELFNTGTVSGLALTMNNSSKFVNGGGAQLTLARLAVSADCTATNSGGATMTMTIGTTTPGVTGNGHFINSGTFITQHNGTPGSNFSIEGFFEQIGGSFVVRGISSNLGTVINGSCLFSDGSIQMEDNANLRFASFAPMVMNGLFTITGNGNVFIQVPPFGAPPWHVGEPLTVSLSGSTGFALNGNNYSLSAPLTNTGKALWTSGFLREAECDGCDGRLVNQSPDFIIDAIAGPNATLDAPFDNHGIVTHKRGSLIIDDDGHVNNGSSGVYRLISGGIQPAVPTIAATFTNAGTFIKPDDPATMDSVITTVFGLTATGLVHVQDHKLTFVGGNGSGVGLSMFQGQITVDDGATVELSNGTHVLESGQGTISGSGRMEAEAISGFANVVVAAGATLTVNMSGMSANGAHLLGGGRFGGPGQLINTGMLTWNGGRVGAPLPLSQLLEADVFNRGVTELTSGSIIGSPAALLTRFTNDTGAILDQFPGSLQLTNSVAANKGMWTCRPSPGVPVTISGLPLSTEFRNEAEGIFVVQPGGPSGSVVVSTLMRNLGTVVVRNHGTLSLQSVFGLDGDLITVGRWIIEPGGIIDFPGFAHVTRIGKLGALEGNDTSCPEVTPNVNEGQLTFNDDWGCDHDFSNSGDVVGDEGTFTCPNDFFNNGGTCTINDGATCSVGGDCINDEGTISLDGGALECDQDINNGTRGGGSALLSYAESQTAVTVAGGGPSESGFFCQAFNNFEDGRIRPGGLDAPGPFHITGDLHQFDGGAIEIELGGLMPIFQHDQVIVNGDVFLDGEVHVSIIAPFEPTRGQQFTILTVNGGTISGQFDVISSKDGQFSASYSPTSVVLTFNGVATPGDLDGNDIVNGIDLGILLSQWLTPGGSADLNGDGVVNGIDLGILLNNWTL